MATTYISLCGMYNPYMAGRKLDKKLLTQTNYMKTNMGNVDRIIRVLLAIVAAVLYFTGTVTGTWGMVLLVLGGVFLAVSAIGFCPLYAIFGLNTCGNKK